MIRRLSLPLRVMSGALALLLVLFPSSAAAQQTRGDVLVEAGASVADVLSEGRRFALVIGNANYDDPTFPDLSFPHADAEAVAAEVSENYGFETTLETDAGAIDLVLLDASLRDIDRAMLRLRENLRSEDTLLIYFAGHGIWSAEASVAAWLPRDAERGLLTSMFTTENLQRHLQAMPARKVLVVSDSCYAGRLLGDVSDVLPAAKELRAAALAKVVADRSRVFLAAGTNEPVADGGGNGRNSIFTSAFLAGLEEMRDDIFSAQELFIDYIAPFLGNASQKPVWMPFERLPTGHEGGDFVFARVAAVAPAAPVPEPASDIEDEDAAFLVALGEDTRAAWLAFLAAHPRGRLAATALDRLRELQDAGDTVVETVNPGPAVAAPADAGPAGAAPISRPRVASLPEQIDLSTLEPAPPRPASPTLEAIRARGYLTCGVNGYAVGFSTPDANNNWVGLDVDYCRALAAAIFIHPDAVRFVPLTSTERWQALAAGEVDLLSRTSTWTMARDTSLGVKFVGTMFYDGQGFMARRVLGVTSATELSGATVCIEAGTTLELKAADYFAANGMEFNSVVFVTSDEVVQAYQDGRCDVLTNDTSFLAGQRAIFADPDAHIILPEVISKEPLSLVVREGDDRWFEVVLWVYNALLSAEELGITQGNIDELLGSDHPLIQRLLGTDGTFGDALGLARDWAYAAIKAVGNYGESFERNLGPDTPLRIERGLNALWRDGGLQMGMPIP